MNTLRAHNPLAQWPWLTYNVRQKMWPFKKANRTAVPDRVIEIGVVARYNVSSQFWWFELEGIDVLVRHAELPEKIFPLAVEAMRIVQKLDRELREKASKLLDESFRKDSMHIGTIDLTSYEVSKSFEVGFIADESWGDFGVEVVVTDGKITDVYGGD